MKGISILLITVTLLAGIAGCGDGGGGVEYDLTITSTEGGEVTSPGEGTSSYDEETEVSLVATAEEEYYFVKWTGDVDTVDDADAIETTITMSDNYSIAANFVPDGAEPVWDWHDLDAIRDNLGASYLLMNDLDSATAGYIELAGTTANDGKGWQPIGMWDELAEQFFHGIFDGQGYEICDLFINRPDEVTGGLFGCVVVGGVIEHLGVVNADVTGGTGVGSLVGINGGTVSSSYATAVINGNYAVGGLVGLISGHDAAAEYGLPEYFGNGTVSKSYSTCSVSGNTFIGGLVGLNGGPVSNCYATGSVSGNSSVGGLVGENGSGTVSNSYSTGSVTGNLSVGGLVSNDNGIVTNSFWDTETSGQTTSDGGTGKTTTEMQDITTFSGATWDIIAVASPDIRNTSYIWNIVDDVTYPFLSWEPVS